MKIKKEKLPVSGLSRAKSIFESVIGKDNKQQRVTQGKKGKVIKKKKK